MIKGTGGRGCPVSHDEDLEYLSLGQDSRSDPHKDLPKAVTLMHKCRCTAASPLSPRAPGLRVVRFF